MTTAPRPGAHLATARHAPEQLRAEVEPLLDELSDAGNDLASLEALTAVAERAHDVLIEALSGQEVR
jgi:hypothetical protein